MKIGINALFFRFLSTGSGQYLTHLLNALAEVDSENEYVLLGPDPLPQDFTLNEHFHFEQVPYPNLIRRNLPLEKLFWEQYAAPAGASRAKADLFHVPFFAPPYFSRTPAIATIHDIIPVRLAVYRESPLMRAYMQLVTRAAHKAALIITVSQHAKQDIVDVLKVPPERIRVTYEAAGDEYKPVTDPDILARARARYDLSADSRYIFYLGGLDHRKNVPLLVRAFAHVYQQANDPNLQLLIAGNPDQKSGPLFPDPRPVAADLGMSGQIIYRYIEEEDKPAMYSGASAFVFPSYYEGFGLPPLEAMSCGAPVICSNRTSLPEVVGDAAITFDPDNTGQLVAALRDVLANSELEADLRSRSLQQAAHFNWRKTAAETLAIYEEVYKRCRKA
ncbi:MAG TPA: glycosyltransferase family 1 protein [Ktedonobacteraceae bacterium]|nr:glycosyltransferase family 1 protein [Ktedonobacteraceae bacterium]